MYLVSAFRYSKVSGTPTYLQFLEAVYNPVHFCTHHDAAFGALYLGAILVKFLLEINKV